MKHEINDAMVERLLSASTRMQNAGDRNAKEAARYMLDAALNPTPDPEIPVSEGMRTAARLLALDLNNTNKTAATSSHLQGAICWSHATSAACTAPWKRSGRMKPPRQLR